MSLGLPQGCLDLKPKTKDQNEFAGYARYARITSYACVHTITYFRRFFSRRDCVQIMRYFIIVTWPGHVTLNERSEHVYPLFSCGDSRVDFGGASTFLDGYSARARARDPHTGSKRSNNLRATCERNSSFCDFRNGSAATMSARGPNVSVRPNGKWFFRLETRYRFAFTCSTQRATPFDVMPRDLSWTPCKRPFVGVHKTLRAGNTNRVQSWAGCAGRAAARTPVERCTFWVFDLFTETIKTMLTSWTIWPRRRDIFLFRISAFTYCFGEREYLGWKKRTIVVFSNDTYLHWIYLRASISNLLIIKNQRIRRVIILPVRNRKRENEEIELNGP